MKIIFIRHGEPNKIEVDKRSIRRYTAVGSISYCEPSEVDYNKEFKCFGWV